MVHAPHPTVSHDRRPVRSRVRHGEPSCADYGCTRAVCREAARKARRARDAERARGLRGRVDAAPAAGYALLLRERGMSAQDIADASGISVTLIRRLLKPAAQRPAQISRTTAEAVLGVPLPPHAGALIPAGRGLTDAAIAAGQLTELASHGWSAARLAAHLHISTRTVAAIRDGHQHRIHVALDQRIKHLHRHLRDVDPTTAGMRPGDAARARAWARHRAARAGSTA